MEVPWCIDHLQQDRKVLGAVLRSNPRTSLWHWCIEEDRWGKHVSEFEGKKGDNGRVDSENRASAHHLYISVLEIESLVARGSPFAIALLDII